VGIWHLGQNARNVKAGGIKINEDHAKRTSAELLRRLNNE